MSQAAPPAAAVARLPVLATVRGAYAIVLAFPSELGRVAAAPFVLSVLIAALAVVLPAHPVSSLILAFASLAPFAIFAVAVCRLALLGAPPRGLPLRPEWRQRHWRFFVYLAVLSVVAFAFLVPPLLVGTMQVAMLTHRAETEAAVAWFLIGETAMITGVSYLLARLAFVLPAAAVDESYGWRHAWAHTRGQGLRLLAALVLSILPTVILLSLLWALLGVLDFPEVDPAVMREASGPEEVIRQYLAENAGRLALAQLATTASSYVVMSVAMPALALAFRTCTGWVPAATLAEPA